MFIKFKEQPSCGGEVWIIPNMITAILSNKVISDYEVIRKRFESSHEEEHKWSVEIIHNRSCSILGYYSTPERAIEILSIIEKVLINQSPTTFIMPEE